MLVVPGLPALSTCSQSRCLDQQRIDRLCRHPQTTLKEVKLKARVILSDLAADIASARRLAARGFVARELDSDSVSAFWEVVSASACGIYLDIYTRWI